MNAVLFAEMSPMSVAAMVFIGTVIWMLLSKSNRYFRAQRTVSPAPGRAPKPAPSPSYTPAPALARVPARD